MLRLSMVHEIHPVFLEPLASLTLTIFFVVVNN
jgi:hypothetical protein